MNTQFKNMLQDMIKTTQEQINWAERELETCCIVDCGWSIASECEGGAYNMIKVWENEDGKESYNFMGDPLNTIWMTKEKALQHAARIQDERGDSKIVAVHLNKVANKIMKVLPSMLEDYKQALSKI